MLHNRGRNQHDIDAFERSRATRNRIATFYPWCNHHRNLQLSILSKIKSPEIQAIPTAIWRIRATLAAPNKTFDKGYMLECEWCWAFWSYKISRASLTNATFQNLVLQRKNIANHHRLRWVRVLIHKNFDEMQSCNWVVILLRIVPSNCNSIRWKSSLSMLACARLQWTNWSHVHVLNFNAIGRLRYFS